MSAGLIVAIIGTAISAAVGFGGLGVALVARRDAKRSEGAAAESARAATRTAELMQEQMDAQLARAEPRVDLHVLRCDHLYSDTNNSTIMVAYVVHNLSTEPELVRDVEVVYENTARNLSGGAVVAHFTESGQSLAPLPLKSDERIERTLQMSVGRRLSDADRIPAQLSLACDRAGRVATDFTIYQR